MTEKIFEGRCNLSVCSCRDGHVHLVVATQGHHFDMPATPEQAEQIAAQLPSQAAAARAAALIASRESVACH